MNGNKIILTNYLYPMYINIELKIKIYIMPNKDSKRFVEAKK